MTPKESAAEVETYTVEAVGKNGDTPITLEEFLMRKLGTSTGKKLYKELVTSVKDCARSSRGTPAIDLGTKRGAFVILQSAS